MNSKKALHTISAPSTVFTTEAFWDGRGTHPAIRFGYLKDGSEIHDGIKFGNVCAMRKRAERCCTEWHIRDAYDTLVEVEDSDWVKEVRADMAERWRNKWDMHHYMIYLDSAGCFEVIAASWTPE
jgi:hypothetical protein